ncbi:N-formylglutamate amidohydrolase [Polaromonas sp. A23]|uniref:N-formylglutamate amidohydrolase n=1 Tax=Polaromonas sp. A23 TaxID=1944133 RepID=UPI000987B8C7|nr:N-formylglutamate amidohydrolase [Polaromonas sp. A23]OOG41101.1 hypothetical protein B0B52_12215 [Polaromonas sp. A23]
MLVNCFHTLTGFAFLLLLAGSAQAYDAENLVVARQGSMPVIFAVPHDGVDPVPGVPPRSQGTTVRDLNSRVLAERAADLIEKRTGKRPYLVVAKFSRKFVDANRAEHEALESPEALPAYRAYHVHLAAFIAEVRQRYPGGALLIDVHGQASDAGTVFRGTRNGWTVKSLVARHGEAAILGEASLIGPFQAAGWQVHPTEPGAKEHTKYNGGNTVFAYGSNNPQGIDAIQLEFGKSMRDDPRAAEAFADAVISFERKYLSDSK